MGDACSLSILCSLFNLAHSGIVYFLYSNLLVQQARKLKFIHYASWQCNIHEAERLVVVGCDHPQSIIHIHVVVAS